VDWGGASISIAGSQRRQTTVICLFDEGRKEMRPGRKSEGRPQHKEKRGSPRFARRESRAKGRAVLVPKS